MTDELKGLLSSQVDDVELRPGAAAAALAGAASRHRARSGLALALAAGLVASGVGAALVLGGDDAGERETLAAVPPPADPNAALLVRDGDRVTGSGRVVQVPGGPVQFCGSGEGVPAIAYAPGQEPAPAGCGARGITVEGVDLEALTDRREKAGAVEGQAQLTGVYRGGVLAVQEQGPPDLTGGPTLTEVDFTVPPCPPPAGGWPAGAAGSLDVEPFAAFQRENPGLAVMFAQASPPGAAPVMVVLAQGEAARERLEAGLRPAYGGSLCVIAARHTAAEERQAREALDIGDPVLRGTSSGTYLDADWQQVVGVSVMVVDEPVLALAQAQPAGLVRLSPQLTRIS